MTDKADQPVIMVVDDERDFLQLTRLLLEKHGYKVEARTKAPSWRELLHLDPALMLIDLMLERENGAEVCRAIKAHDHLARIPIILVSGHGEDRLKKEVSWSGAEGFLTKPISKALLLQLARHYTGRRGAAAATDDQGAAPGQAAPLDTPSPAPPARHVVTGFVPRKPTKEQDN